MNNFKLKTVVVTALFGATTALTTFLFYNFMHFGNVTIHPPFEDAAMLFRYANNLADGNGITWNAGEAPGISDGATDLGFVLVLAPLIWAGITAPTAAFIINILAICGIGSIIAVVTVQMLKQNRILAVATTFLIFSGPTVNYIAAGFSPTVLGLLLLIVGFLTIYSNSKMSRRPWIFATGIAAGICGWWRPEGFALSSICFVAIYVGTEGFPKSLITLKKYMVDVIFFVIGLSITFAAWATFRLLYFGHLLPTSAVNKAKIVADPLNFVDSISFYLIFLLPFTGAVWLLSKDKKSKISGFVFLILFGSAIWMYVTPILNWWQRMQWPLIPVMALSALFLVSSSNMFVSEPGAKKINVWNSARFLAISIVLGILINNWTTGKFGNYFEAPMQVSFSRALSEIETQDIKMVTTEAGLIPLALRNGQVLDSWGLNNREIASDRSTLNKVMTNMDPNVLVVHGMTPRVLSQVECINPPFAPAWVEMVETMYTYAENPSNNFELIRSESTGPCDYWSVFAKKGVSKDFIKAVKTYPDFGSELFISKAD